MKPVAYYALSNNSAVSIYEIDHDDDKVLAGGTHGDSEWCTITADGEGFMWGELYIPFDECMRV